MTNSFEDFYRATVKRVFRTACLLAGDVQIAEDATHEAYLVMQGQWSKRRDCSECDNRRYVTRIAANKIADWYRANRGIVPLLEEDDVVALDGPQKIMDRSSLFKEVRRLVESRPPAQRLVGILYLFEEFRPVEIAEMIGIDASTVRTHIQRLRQQLKPLVERLGWLEGGRQDG